MRDASGVELAVIDDGLGFPPEDAGNDFREVLSARRRAAPRDAGHGLGLYIVKRLVELSGGTVARATATVLAAVRRVTMRWPDGGRAVKEPARILVVDDEEHLAAGIRENLEAEGYRADVAHDGSTGLERLRAEAFDLVVLDVMMPNMDGLELCAQLRRDGIQTPVLFLTVKGAAEDRVRGFEAGGDDYLAKPFHLQELLLRVAAILRRSSWYQASGAALDVRRQPHRLQDLRGARVGRRRALADAQGSDDPARAGRSARRHRDARGDPRPRLGLRGVSVDAHDRQLHRALAQALRAQPRSARAFSHGARRRLPLHARSRKRASRADDGDRESNDDKLLLKAIRREAVPRRPLWIMRQAGRYLPEYRAFREKHSFKELAGEAELAAEVTLMPLKRFPLDAAIVFADIMSPMPALGIEFDFDPGPVVANPIRDAAAIERLRRPDAGEIAPEVIAALKLTRAALPNEHRAPRLLRRALDARGLSRRGQGHERLPDVARVRGRGAGAARQLLARLSSLMGEYLLHRPRPAPMPCRSSTPGPVCCRARAGSV